MANFLGLLAERHPRVSAVLGGVIGAPTQTHLSLGAESDELTVTWVTKRECAASFVAWGADGASLHSSAAANTSTYTVPPRWWQPVQLPYIHTAVISGIGSRARFAYSVGDNTSVGCVAAAPVVARAPPRRGELPLRAALMADVGSFQVLGFEVWAALDARTVDGGRGDVDLCVHAGDVSYAGLHAGVPLLNVSKEDEWEPLWDVYGAAHAPFTRRRAYMVGVGNHESFYGWAATRDCMLVACRLHADCIWSAR